MAKARRQSLPKRQQDLERAITIVEEYTSTNQAPRERWQPSDFERASETIRVAIKAGRTELEPVMRRIARYFLETGRAHLILSNVLSRQFPDTSDPLASGVLQEQAQLLFDRLAEELQATTALEEILIERIVMAYHRVCMAELYLSQVAQDGKTFTAETVACYTALVERANAQLLRTLDALLTLRRPPLNVILKGVGQVNAGTQQVNVADGPESSF